MTAIPPVTDVETPLLELRGIKAAYGRIEVVHGVDLVVPAGKVLAILGPNGAGKSTTLKVACGLMAPTAGDLFVAGRRVNGARPDELARAGLCLVPEGKGIFPNLTVRENLRMCTFTGRSLHEIEEIAFARFPRLAERRSQLAGTLSGGEQQMLAMTRGLATDPALLLLDELSMGLAPIIIEELYEVVAQRRSRRRVDPRRRAVRADRPGRRRRGRDHGARRDHLGRHAGRARRATVDCVPGQCRRRDRRRLRARPTASRYGREIMSQTQEHAQSGSASSGSRRPPARTAWRAFAPTSPTCT